MHTYSNAPHAPQILVGSKELRDAADAQYRSAQNLPPFCRGATSAPGEALLASAIAPMLAHRPLHSLMGDFCKGATERQGDSLPPTRFASICFSARGSDTSWSSNAIFDAGTTLSPGDHPSNGRMLFGNALHGSGAGPAGAQQQQSAVIEWCQAKLDGAYLDRSNCWASLLCQSTTLKQPLKNTMEQFDRAFRRKAGLHWYTCTGMDEMEFVEAGSNVRDVVTQLMKREAQEIVQIQV